VNPPTLNARPHLGGRLNVEPFDGKLRDELLNREVFATLFEAKVLTADWRKEYNQFRPHSSLHYRLRVPEAKKPATLTL
jgi:transposase InsO family protein